MGSDLKALPPSATNEHPTSAADVTSVSADGFPQCCDSNRRE